MSDTISRLIRRGLALLAALIAGPALAQDLPMSREGLDSAIAQYFAGADRNRDRRLDRAETAAALGYARELLIGRREEEPFTLDIAPDGRPRLTLNENGPLGAGGVADALFRRTDRDGDGLLSLAEVQAAARERFDAVDKDRDGLLDERERGAARDQIAVMKGLLGG